MRGHKRFKAGAWRLTVNAKDPVTGKRKPVYATVHAPNNKRGEARADSELAKLVAQVETGRTMPTSGMTVEQLIERYVDDRSPSWAPGAADETRKRVAQHIAPHVGSIAIERLRPVDVQQLHSAAACRRPVRGLDRPSARHPAGRPQLGRATGPRR